MRLLDHQPGLTAYYSDSEILVVRSKDVKRTVTTEKALADGVWIDAGSYEEEDKLVEKWMKWK